MKRNTNSKLTVKVADKGCKKKNRCYRSCSSSSSSSCSSSSSSSCSSSSSSSCSSSSSSDGSYDCLKAKYGVITNLTGTTSNFDTGYFNTLNITNDPNYNIPTFVTGSTQSVSVPSRYSDLSQVYLVNTSATINFQKFTTIFNGVRLVFANITTNTLPVTINLTSGDVFASTSSQSSGSISISASSSIEFVGSWNSATNIMTFYRVR